MLRGLRITREYKSDYASEYFNIFFLLTFEKILVQSPLGDRNVSITVTLVSFRGGCFSHVQFQSSLEERTSQRPLPPYSLDFLSQVLYMTPM